MDSQGVHRYRNTTTFVSLQSARRQRVSTVAWLYKAAYKPAKRLYAVFARRILGQSYTVFQAVPPTGG